jgi:hypothetical protein
MAALKVKAVKIKTIRKNLKPAKNAAVHNLFC